MRKLWLFLSTSLSHMLTCTSPYACVLYRSENFSITNHEKFYQYEAGRRICFYTNRVKWKIFTKLYIIQLAISYSEKRFDTCIHQVLCLIHKLAIFSYHTGSRSSSLRDQHREWMQSVRRVIASKIYLTYSINLISIKARHCDA